MVIVLFLDISPAHRSKNSTTLIIKEPGVKVHLMA